MKKYEYEHLELVFKFPEGKPPYLGILYEDLPKGGMFNHHWVEDLKDEDWCVKLEIEQQKLTIILLCPAKNLYNRYEVTYRSGHHLITQFDNEAKKVEFFNFGHCGKNPDGSIVPLRTPRFKPWVLRCSEFKIYNIV